MASNNKKNANKKIEIIEENLKIAEVKEVEEKLIEENKEPQKTINKQIDKRSDITNKDKPIENKQPQKREKINIEEEQKALIEKKENSKKKRTYIAINIFLMLVIILLFSTVFAIMNINNTNIVKGVKIKNIDISNLSVEEAKNKITEAINIELIPEIKLKYEEYETTIKPKNFEYNYKIDFAIEEAKSIGRNGNVLENNYELLLVAFWGKDIDINAEYNEEQIGRAHV